MATTILKDNDIVALKRANYEEHPRNGQAQSGYIVLCGLR